ncbi:MAG: hypothetical protein AVDCRST_MAG59-3603, partial [uncultured Thermomicrobiales bacterium]
GMVTFTNDDLRGKLLETFGVDASDTDFLPISDLEQGLRDDVATIRSSPLIPAEVAVTGYVYDVRTGKLAEVAAG